MTEVLPPGVSSMRFVEKTPQHIIRLPFILKHFPQAHVIHIVRDGRDAYVSANRHKGIPTGRSAARYASYWNKCVGMTIKNKSPHVAVIKYEDFVRDPRKELKVIMGFLGLQMEEQQLDPKVFGKDIRSRSENFLKLSTPINGASVGRWRTILSKDEKSIFETVAYDSLKHYGYM